MMVLSTNKIVAISTYRCLSHSITSIGNENYRPLQVSSMEMEFNVTNYGYKPWVWFWIQNPAAQGWITGVKNVKPHHLVPHFSEVMADRISFELAVTQCGASLEHTTLSVEVAFRWVLGAGSSGMGGTATKGGQHGQLSWNGEIYQCLLSDTYGVFPTIPFMLCRIYNLLDIVHVAPVSSAKLPLYWGSRGENLWDFSAFESFWRRLPLKSAYNTTEILLKYYQFSQ